MESISKHHLAFSILVYTGCSTIEVARISLEKLGRIGCPDLLRIQDPRWQTNVLFGHYFFL